MDTSQERVFILGGTGNVGSKAVKDLLAKNIPVTIYSRQPEKVYTLFSNNPLVQVVQGDYSDMTPLKDGLKGHTRLLLLIADLPNMPSHKKTIASWAYEAGVRQIVDISSLWSSFPWRTTFIGTQHYYAEKAIYELPGRGAFVALRPGRFMSNLFHFGLYENDHILDTLHPDQPQGWISTNDIGAVAATILSDDIQKHGDAVYELNGDVVTPKQLAEHFSRALGRPFGYKQISALDKYNRLMSSGYMNHSMAFGLSTTLASYDIQNPLVSDGIQILLGRNPEKLEEYIMNNKHLFKH
ncbi:hypothetical protein G6F70_006880 [Rhizopus microsporus]|uniref:NmrA-like domain-containing protein n=2 Tax=Rhizopus TaxID=4842 RepID=A0A367J7R7_RHIAZ|nr:hypothetical protein G6F71_006964 [Rhizopus microsporus]RCH85987.1 hypothetical protein CU097_008425 [Rhizopus azygosporus]KAG1197126.1 hypothetical protein G6F70_006880 [Rhizopus microsporus]KAG1208791.1 hypothetical protein G6F69_006911 [Rhizopus microsporus]KAG1230335.1 hypothetical protein G6F67_006527 [Rhizopus microsporus]